MKAGGKGGDASGGFYAYDPLRRNINNAHILGRGVAEITDYLIQNRRKRVFSGSGQCSLLLKTCFYCFLVFFQCIFMVHCTNPFFDKDIYTPISYPFSALFATKTFGAVTRHNIAFLLDFSRGMTYNEYIIM